MFKKRPREHSRKSSTSGTNPPASKMEVAYWRQHLFKNTYTYKGRRKEVRGWSVKIQLLGKRKTLSLHSSNRLKAAREACRLYQTIRAQGWEAVEDYGSGTDDRSYMLMQNDETATSVESVVREHWRSRLVYRPYPRPESPNAERELCVRIEHRGTACHFPLGTNHEEKAIDVAMEIYRSMVQEGWQTAVKNHPRELTVALRWLDDPLAWTYTTFHTWVSQHQAPTFAAPLDGTHACHVAIVEPDAGIRFALVSCVNSQNGFGCCQAYADGVDAAHEILRRKIDLVLVNHTLPDRPGSTFLVELQRVKPSIVGLRFSVFEDSDELFKSTPGGAAGYMLKRTPRNQLFNPIADAAASLTPELVAVKLREYFERLITAMPSGPSEVDRAKLTPREHEVLALLANGYLAKTIGIALGISIWTVHGHVKNIFEKLNVHSRTEAVVKYLQK